MWLFSLVSFLSQSWLLVYQDMRKKELESRRTEITSVSISEPTLSLTRENGDPKETLNHDVPDELEKYKLEQAATKAQATFRGYRACRAFRTLKGIVRFQAVIRGHLVRRQAIATLNCFLGIVKFQALVRGRMVRRYDLGSQIYAKKTHERRYAPSELEKRTLDKVWEMKPLLDGNDMKRFLHLKVRHGVRGIDSASARIAACLSIRNCRCLH